MKNWTIRLETPADHRSVEELTKKAFWNLHTPGCDEHYLVHVMRTHGDFIPELAFVLEQDDRIIGNIMYTKARLIHEDTGTVKEILSFGPVSILPGYQRKGFGKALMEHSFDRAQDLGHRVIVIFGNPSNYVSLGFQSCARHSISLGRGLHPSALLVKELVGHSIDGGKWVFQESGVYHVNQNDAEVFDEGFEAWEKQFTPSQEEFFILSQSRIHLD